MLTLMRLFVLFVCFVVASSCTSEKKTAPDTTAARAAITTVAGTRIAVPHAGPPGEWQMPAGDYASSRYSTLNSITPVNAANLRTSWAFSTGVLRGHEGQPLVIGNTMYVI